MNDVALVLRKAREMLAVPGVWGQGDDALDRGCQCMLNAIGSASADIGKPSLDGIVGRADKASKIVARVVGAEYASEWNDAPSRTLDEVLAALDEAADAGGEGR